MRHHLRALCLCAVALGLCVAVTQASLGDRQPHYAQCVKRCTRGNCTGHVRPFYMPYTGWLCEDECRYTCMWDTVALFLKEGRSVPQFHGKWPFVRLLCIQEPLSALASLLNGLSYYAAMVMYRKKIPSTAPIYQTVIAFSLIGMNTWLWSTVFHCKDTPWTEKMDYFSATSLILYSIYFCCIRTVGQRHPGAASVFGAVLVSFFAYHVWYMGFVRFDYGYNIIANATIGLVNLLWWLGWCLRSHRERPYVWRCAFVVLCLHGLALLELLDFPPLLWTLDAHALWHIGTIPLPLVFYRFLIEDSLYLLKEQELKKIY
uniref:Post-GPI attachment to proteins factor 3 n=1 Tax=Petromyzon marinus TaxID=7757 RepID=A0AAJ7SXJ3_PETMA|nr:post-GPI attachment to proteins factor 3 [Petromyzon marinus]